jgi:hypothetical protein
MMTEPAPLILWTIRVACVLYVAAVASVLVGRPAAQARWLWTLGCLFYLGHVWAAFALAHHWSHQSAWDETARQTAEVFGVRSGSGIWWNYTFTALWVIDAAWWWAASESYRQRPVWITAAVHGFFAFLFFNGAGVFASGATRWLGLAATLLLGVLWWKRRRYFSPSAAGGSSSKRMPSKAAGDSRPACE